MVCFLTMTLKTLMVVSGIFKNDCIVRGGGPCGMNTPQQYGEHYS